MFENRIKTLLAQGKTAWGAGLPDASDIMAKLSVNTGIDFLWIDLEHRSYSTHEVRWVPIICRQKGCAAMVRVPGLDPSEIKKALDIGANTIMVPQVNTAEEARLAVEYAKYPPQGTRGVSPTWTLLMDVSWGDYLPVANQETCVVVQIESPAGIENLDAIAAVEGVDIVFAGPADISASLGCIGEINHPEVQKLLAEFPGRVAKHNKPAGITFADKARCRLAFDEGYRFINIGSLAQQGTIGLTADLQEMRAHEEAAKNVKRGSR